MSLCFLTTEILSTGLLNVQSLLLTDFGTDTGFDNLLYFLHYLVLKQYALIVNIISPKLVMPT